MPCTKCFYRIQSLEQLLLFQSITVKSGYVCDCMNQSVYKHCLIFKRDFSLVPYLFRFNFFLRIFLQNEYLYLVRKVYLNELTVLRVVSLNIFTNLAILLQARKAGVKI